MPTGTQLLAAALEEVLASLVHGIGDAQKEMDRSTIALQREIDADPQLAVHGVQATWYQVPKTEIELRVALTIDNPPAPSTPAPTPIPGTGKVALRQIRLYPVNATYQNQFAFDASVASTLRMTVAPVPPRLTDALPAKLTADQAMQAAAPLLVQGVVARITATFNAGARSWAVVQFQDDPAGPTTLAVVDVDDDSGRAARR